MNIKYLLNLIWSYLIPLIFLTGLIFLFVERPPAPCKVESFQIYLSTNGVQFEEIDTFNAESIEIRESNFVTIEADIQPGPLPCSGSPYVEWSLFSDNALNQAKISGTPSEESIEITLRATTAETVVSINILDASGTLQDRVLLPLSINGES